MIVFLCPPILIISRLLFHFATVFIPRMVQLSFIDDDKCHIFFFFQMINEEEKFPRYRRKHFKLDGYEYTHQFLQTFHTPTRVKLITSGVHTGSKCFEQC